MIELLVANPLLLLFVVSALGFLLGHVRVGGFSLGVAAVLFVGLGFGALDPRLALPEIVQTLGLVLFVYSVGLSSGPGFFGSLRRRGLKVNLLALGALAATAALAVVLARLVGLGGPHLAGVFAGATTNTPALASVMDALARSAPADASSRLAPVVGYSIAYPFGVLGSLGAIFLARRLLPSEDAAGGPASDNFASAIGETIVSAAVKIEHPVEEVSSVFLKDRMDLRVVFGRLRRDGQVTTVRDETVLRRGDVVTVIGNPASVDAAIHALGTRTEAHLELDRESVDFRRIFVSRHDVVERPLGSLALGKKFGAVVTRIRRGDIEFVPDEGTELELGDRVRVVAPREQMDGVSRFLGDSYKALSEVDLVPFGIGVALGLLLGVVPLPLWGGTSFRLGFAGGPLLVGLVLGKLGRSGPLVWTLPYSAGLTLRQIGVVFFLAGVGTRSGWALVTTVRSGGALPLFLVGLALTVVVTSLLIVLGGRLLRIPSGLLLGMIAGVQTQPADLSFALDQARNEMPTVGYASVYPMATIAKILLAQILLSFLGPG
ncbi:MAG: transporter [Polyangiaceae bacterium]|nr:transporter [Polyangiaceae bacterium]